MRIGIVCYPTFGGSGVVATELGMALAKKGHRIHFITYSQPIRLNLLNKNLLYHKVDMLPYPLFEYAPYELALASKIVEVTKNEGLDLIHAHYAVPHASAAYMARQILSQQNLHVPIVTTLHGTDITLVGKDESYKHVVAFSINQSDGITSVSQNLRKSTFDFFDIKKDIEVIPNFIDSKKFNTKQTWDIKQNICTHFEKLIIHVSNFRKVKRIQDVIMIFEKIQQQHPAKLLMIGDGPERSDAEVLTRKLGIAEKVYFLGRLENFENELSHADLFLMPSEKESFGLAALEAMAYGTPVVSSDVGGIPELNIHNVTGYISSVGDIEEMANYALQALDSKNLKKLKKNARQQAKKFDLNIILPLYENYYQKIIEKVSALNKQKSNVG